MAAVDSFYLLYREVARTCHCYVEALAVVGAWYTARKTIGFLCDSYSLIRLHFIPGLISRTDLLKQYGKWAIVNGAADSIGKAYAEELAGRGINIILIGHQNSTLQIIAKNLSETFSVEVVVIETDLSSGRDAYSPIRETLRDKEIGILINNVNVRCEYPQYFTQVHEDRLWDIINVNIAAASMMVHIVLPGMIDRKKGAIVNISSGSCCKPSPQKTAYSASKAYLDHFSRSLHYEYASKGIFVQSLMPFDVASHRTAAFDDSHSWLVPSARTYARCAVSTLGLSNRTTGYWSHTLQFLFAQYMPEWLWIQGMNLLNNRLHKETFS
ncbi:inactive hydroxysteroid dehydrogenase-like protein 1 [Protopterus annectens]|uniref:inactive hydroxysteroid dehydrogenase-like protein 1 n=1 Tax=Protopterus annectens TaxID=7888 RepID=UPI001CFB8D13|nr:inactive hydroxysteroid dehydrogenase-like protein 1 [Protopterus annectens]